MENNNIKDIKRGDIYLYDFGNNEGSIQCGERPVLVIQSNYFEKSPTVIVAAITSALKKEYLPSHIFLYPKYGLDYNSMVMLEQLKTVNKNELKNKIGFIEDSSVWQKINKALKQTFDLWIHKDDRVADIRCLCFKCVRDYKIDPNFILKRLDPFSRKVDKCFKCDNLGYDYVIYDRKDMR